MRGSRVVSRLPRQARSGVTYKEIEDGDESVARVPSPDAVVRSSLQNQVEELGVAKGKRTLTLKRARTILEPPVRLEEITSIHAIHEALSPNHGRQVVESAKGRHDLSSAFDYLLEAVNGASGDGEDDGAAVGQHFSAPKAPETRNDQEEEMTLGAYDLDATLKRKLLAKDVCTEGTNVLKGLTHSSEEENRFVNSIIGKGMEEAMGKKSVQDGISSADEKRYSRRGMREKQNSMFPGGGKKVEEQRQENVSCANENIVIRAIKNGSKKIEEDVLDSVPGRKDSKDDEDNVPSEDNDEDAEDSWSESSDASNAEKKRKITLPMKEKNNTSVLATKPGQELKTFVKKSKLAKKDSSASGSVLMPLKPRSVVTSLLPRKRPALWVGTKPFVPPGPLTLSSRSVAHRRVVGLSRRYRPPPLHPYLLGS